MTRRPRAGQRVLSPARVAPRFPGWECVLLALWGLALLDRAPVAAAPGSAAAVAPSEPISEELPIVDRTPPVRVVASSASGVEFIFEPGAPVRRPDVDLLGEAEQIEFSRLAAVGATRMAEPGQPRTLSWNERVWIPPGATWTLRFELEEGPRFTGVRLARLSPTGVRRGARFPGAEQLPEPVAPAAWPALEDRDWPESPVTAVEDELRGERILTVALAPYQYNGRSGELRTFARLRVYLEFSGSDPSPSPPLDVDRAPTVDPGRALLAGSVLNPPAPEASRRSRSGLTPATAVPALQPGVPPEYFGTTGEWIKVSVRKNGICRVTGKDLQDAGVNLGAIDPATLRVFSGSGLPLDGSVAGPAAPDWGEPGGFSEVGSRVDAGGDPRFETGDAVYFYGLGVDNFRSTFGASTEGGDAWIENPHTDVSVYWITWGGGFAAAPVRWTEQSAAPQPGGEETTTATAVRHFEVNDPALYDPLPWERRTRWEKWWWQRIDDSGPGSFWDLSLPDPDPSQPAALFARWWGSNVPREDNQGQNYNTHHLTVTVNGGAAVNATWTGITRYDMTIPFTATPTPRVVGQVIRFDGPSRVDEVLLGWFEITYLRKLRIPAAGEDKGQLWFSGPTSDGAGRQFRVTGVTTSEPLVLDVTDPRRPVRLTDGQAQAEVSGRSVKFRAADATGRRYLVTTGDVWQAPTAVRRDARPARWLRDTANAADYILITADEFLSAGEVLGNWRRQHLSGVTDGPSPRAAGVAVIRISDIYDEFSGGMVDPTAIRNFLQYADLHWTGNGSGAPAPLYLCLLGDANRDTRDYEQTGVKNLLPTWQDGLDLSSSSDGNPQFSSDDFFVRLGGPNDRLADLIVGRIPAVTPEMALQIVQEKVIASERPTVPNPNRTRAVLTADDNCQAGHSDNVGSFVHMRQSETVDRSIPAQADRAKINLYDYGTGCDILLKPAAKRDLLSTMNAGCWLINFIGHGSDQQIYDEKMLEVPDVATLNNLGALPLLVAASCSVGKFDRASSEGLAEALMKAANGGCLATIAATHLSFSGDNLDLNVRLMQKLFPNADNRTVPMGAALWLAKQSASPSSCSTDIQPGCDRQQKYSLLGDPAATPIIPGRQVRFTARPDSLIRGRTVTVSGEVLTADGQSVDTAFRGSVNLRVEDQPELRRGDSFFSYAMPGARLFEGETQVAGGRFTASFVVPVSLRGGGNGRLRAYVASTGGAAGGALTEAVGALAPLPIGGIPSGTPDTEPPAIVVSVPGGRATPGATLRVAIADTSGINLTGLFEFRSVLMTVADEAGRDRFRTNLTDDFAYDSGSYSRGRVETKIPTLPPGRYRIVVSATDNFNNRGEGSLELQVGGGAGGLAVSNLFNYPNPFEETTQIYFSLSEAGPAQVGLYTVSGRRIRQWELAGVAGQNDLEWDGRDAEGDAVANGVYLLRVRLKGASGRAVDAIERIVRLR